MRPPLSFRGPPIFLGSLEASIWRSSHFPLCYDLQQNLSSGCSSNPWKTVLRQLAIHTIDSTVTALLFFEISISPFSSTSTVVISCTVFFEFTIVTVIVTT